jgi:hypothetical protein
MVSLLSLIADTLAATGVLSLWAMESAINATVVAIAASATFLLGLLPSIPAPPSQPASPWIGWLNWIFPLGPAITAATGLLVLYTLLLGLRVALRWVKAL